jgi:4-amino-4-deoxy-L-arabinose transferase-like glycosyltransferase
VPTFEAPDEPGHYAYVQWLLEGRGVPLQGDEPPPLQPEFSQPPLYYLIEAPVAWLAGTSPDNLPEWEAQHNPFQDQTDFGNVNLYFHLPREGFPWSGAVLGLHLMRLANLGFVALLVVSAYGCAAELGWSEPLRLLTAGLVGLTPQVVFLGGALNADNAIGSFATLGLWLVLRWLRRGPSAGLAVVMGLALGAASLSKLSGLAAAAVGIAFMGLRTFVSATTDKGAPRGRSTALLRDCVVAAAVAALVAGWWYARNWVELGDPLGWSAMLPATGAMQRSVPLGFGEAMVRLTLRAYTGLAAFGWANLWLHPLVYRVASIVGVMGIVGAGMVAARRRLELRHWLLLAWFGAFFVSLARWVEVNTAADQWRLLFPAYPVLGLLVARGLWALVGRLWPLFPAGLLALNLGAIPLTILPSYSGPTTYSGQIEHPMDVRFGDTLLLAGYSTPQPRQAKTGETVEVDLYWRALRPITKEYATDLAAIDARDRITWKRQSMPDEGRAPMALWRPGELVLDRHRLRIDPSLAGAQTLLLSVIDPLPPGDHLPASGGDGQRLSNDTATLGRFLAAPGSIPPPAVKDNVTFQDHLQLVGHSIEQADTQLRVTLDWKATGAAVSKDYTVFAHLVTSDGRQVAQNDGQPGGGAYPTSLLGAGFEAPDTHTLDVSGLPPGDYRLEVGLYELASGVRLATVQGENSVNLDVRIT